MPELVQIKIGKWSCGSNEATSVWLAEGHKIKVGSWSTEEHTSIITLHFVDGKWHEVLPSRRVHEPVDIFAATRESEDETFITRLHRDAVERTVAFLDA